MSRTTDIRELLCQGSEQLLDPLMHPKIRAWSEPATALQILEVLDECIYSALASGFMVATLQTLYKMACDREGTTHDEVVKLATWRTSKSGDTAPSEK